MRSLTGLSMWFPFRGCQARLPAQAGRKAGTGINSSSPWRRSAAAHGARHLNGRVRPGARREEHVEMPKARLAVAEAVGGAGDCQAGEGSRRFLGARGRATSALVAAAHGLRLALPGGFPSTAQPRLFDQLSYPLKTPRSQTRGSRASASPRSRASEVKAMVNDDMRTP